MCRYVTSGEEELKAMRLGPAFLMKDGMMIPLKMMTKRHWNQDAKGTTKTEETKKSSKKNSSAKGDK